MLVQSVRARQDAETFESKDFRTLQGLEHLEQYKQIDVIGLLKLVKRVDSLNVVAKSDTRTLAEKILTENIRAIRVKKMSAFEFVQILQMMGQLHLDLSDHIVYLELQFDQILETSSPF